MIFISFFSREKKEIRTSRGGGTRAAVNGGEGEIDYYHTRRGEYGVSRTEAPERKASKKYPKPRKGRAVSNGGEGNFLE